MVVSTTSATRYRCLPQIAGCKSLVHLDLDYVEVVILAPIKRSIFIFKGEVPGTFQPCCMSSDLESVFAELGLSQYLGAFVEQGFDEWDIILDIQESDLYVPPNLTGPGTYTDCPTEMHWASSLATVGYGENHRPLRQKLI